MKRISLSNKPFIVIDLNSGSYIKDNTGHECFNLEKDIDNKYYGYCPPYNNIDIKRHFNANKNDNCVYGILVIYVEHLQNSTKRKIIAFCDNATIYREPQINKKSKRFILEGRRKKYIAYTIESDNLYNLQSYSIDNPFIIDPSKYGPHMFRKQRFYKGRYEKDGLDTLIIEYLENYLMHITYCDDDDFTFQQKLQECDTIKNNVVDNSNNEPQYIEGSKGTMVKKHINISKQALIEANYKCAIDHNHKTFLTQKGNYYMEGHHLIPCTSTNSSDFWQKYKVNIDCTENIVCLCPNCHRRIHLGTQQDKLELIKELYKQQINKLNQIGLSITVDELLKLYY